jgi:signal peptidase I
MVYVVLAVYVLGLLAAGAITALKGKWGTLVVGFFSFAWLFGAVRLARPDSFWDRRFYDEPQRQRARRVAAGRRKLAVVGLIVALLPTLAVFGLLEAYRIPSANMEPTLHCAKPHPGCRGDTPDRVLALRYVFGRDADAGDIVAFSMPAGGAEKCGSFPGATHVSRVQSVVGDSVRVRGDFREQSCDSSVWGPLPKDRLVAKVVFRYWPLDRLGMP